MASREIQRPEAKCSRSSKVRKIVATNRDESPDLSNGIDEYRYALLRQICPMVSTKRSSKPQRSRSSIGLR